jgi:hypothetical protein
MDRIKRTSAHEAGHVVAALAVGLSIDGASCDPVAAGPGRNGCIWLTPNDYTCKPLWKFSSFMLHELRQVPLAKIEGKPLSVVTFVFFYAKTICLMAGKEAERLLFDQVPANLWSSSDMRGAAFLASTITGTHKAALTLIDRARADAKRILVANRTSVESLAAALLKEGTLDAEQIEAVISGRHDVLQRKQWSMTAAGAAQFMAMTGGGLKPLAI